MPNFDVMWQTVEDFWRATLAFLPRLLLAVVIIIVGWLLAKVARFITEKALRAINFNVLTERAGTDHFLQQGGLRGDTTTVFGLVAYWLVLIAALIVACNGMSLPYLADLLTQLEGFAPRLLLAMLVVVFGSYCARFLGMAVRDHCVAAQISDADMLGRIVRYVVMIFVIMIAISQLQLGGEIVQHIFLILLAGIVLTLALAFGLGGKGWAAALIERWWPTRRRDSEPE
jgi:hypothetical protein